MLSSKCLSLPVLLPEPLTRYDSERSAIHTKETKFAVHVRRPVKTENGRLRHGARNLKNGNQLDYYDKYDTPFTTKLVKCIHILTPKLNSVQNLEEKMANTECSVVAS